MKERSTKLSLVAPGPTNGNADGARGGGRKRLADFIRENTEKIVVEWETFARTLTPASTDMSSLALRDHIIPILQFVVKDIDSAQSGIEQVEKSHGKKTRSPTATAAESHAALRLAGGFDIDQMVSEYRSLRASVVKLWSAENTEMLREDIIDLIRFNETIDQALAESIAHYTEEVNRARNLFLGILGHDLRTPLNVISMSSDLITGLGSLNERQTMLASQISESTARMSQIISDLLDLTRARFGSGLPINRTPMDMGIVSHQLVDEMRVAHLGRTINLDITGDMKGAWDKARIGQIFTNLIGNAMQYSFEYTAIDVSVKGTPDEVIVSVHNEGVPIPPEKIGKIFDPLSRAATDNEDHPATQNLGLGLYITKDIVVSHGGTITVNSLVDEGTTFTIRLPRVPLPKS